MTRNTLGHHFEPCSLEQSTQVMCLKGVKKRNTTSKPAWQSKANASNACDGCSWGKEVLLKNCFNWPQPFACDRNKILQQSVQALLIWACHFKDTWDRGWPGTHLDTTSNHAPWNSQPKSCASIVSRNTVQPQNQHGKTRQMHRECMANPQLTNACNGCSWGKEVLLKRCFNWPQPLACDRNKILQQSVQALLVSVCHFKDTWDRGWPETHLDTTSNHAPWNSQPKSCAWRVSRNTAQPQNKHGKSKQMHRKHNANPYIIDKSMQWLLLGQRGIAQKLLQLASTSCVCQEQNPSTMCAGPTYLSMPFQGHLRPWMTRNTLGHHFEPCSLEQSAQVMCLKGVTSGALLFAQKPLFIPLRFFFHQFDRFLNGISSKISKHKHTMTTCTVDDTFHMQLHWYSSIRSIQIILYGISMHFTAVGLKTRTTPSSEQYGASSGHVAKDSAPICSVKVVFLGVCHNKNAADHGRWQSTWLGVQTCSKWAGLGSCHLGGNCVVRIERPGNKEGQKCSQTVWILWSQASNVPTVSHTHIVYILYIDSLSFSENHPNTTLGLEQC